MSSKFPTSTNSESYRTQRPRKPQQRFKQVTSRERDNSSSFKEIAKMQRERVRLTKEFKRYEK